jgi:D-tyrosyl-tRNA(Tyr) deacylase
MFARPAPFSHPSIRKRQRLKGIPCSKREGLHKTPVPVSISTITMIKFLDRGDSTMRVVVQRVLQAEVQVAGTVVGAIQKGLVVLLGVQDGDTLQDAEYLAAKVVNLRIFEDAQGKMNYDVQDVQGSVLVVSQFTLYGNCRKGRRPSFTRAARPPLARALYEAFLAAVARYQVAIAQGAFGAHMALSLVNDGPVTLLIDSP